MLLRAIVLVIVLCATGPWALAYSLTGARWTGSSATIHLQLGASSTPLIDGFASWGASAEDALSRWNANMGTWRFAMMRDSTATRAGGNRVNNVFFAGDIYGDAWGGNVLAVTLTYTIGSATTETDVLFNNRLSWNSYRGGLRYSTSGTPIYDFHRVALHEFGHALGLDHPDEHGQNVSALMNSRISSLDTLASDDIAGARALYGAPVAVAPPALPTITSQPVSRAVTAGQSASFTVAATSTSTLSYRWLKAGAPIPAATNATLSFASTATTDSGDYAVVVTNSAGSLTSSTATLTVNPPAPPIPAPAPTPPTIIAPTITTQPGGQSVAAGANVTFSVGVFGTAPFSYQWRKNGVAIGNATSATLSLPNVQVADAATYTVLVWNSAASTLSANATLTVAIAPAVTTQPLDQTVAEGARVSLNVAASGTGPLSYRWRKDGADMPNATSATLTIDSAQPVHAGSYAAIVSNLAGSAMSAAARVSVLSAPVISSPPVAQTVTSGERAIFTVGVNSAGPTSYQWLRDGVDIPGANGSSLTLATARPADTAAYSVRITSASGSVTSAPAALTVKFSRLTNLSTRGFVPPGGALTPGFYIRGNSAKPLLVRAVGPTLSLFGVGAALGAAKLDVITQDSSTVVASNNDWGGTSTLSSVFASAGAFPLAADSKDAAVQASLLPRSYTVRVTPGDAAMSGITLAEIYDIEALIGNASELVNLSTLGFVGGGDNVLTAGFAISGNAPKRLLIRAVGPGLAPFGVGDLLSDPQLGLVPLGRSEPIATNDDWPDSDNLRAAFTAAGAFALPSGSKDAALVITLEPGAYTVIVSGVNGTASGNALVEIYDLDP